jgi:hypothetical protein
VRYFSAMCAGVPRIFTSGPLDSKLRVSGLWFFRLLFRPRPRRFCCPCLTAQMAPVLLELLSSMSIPRACEHGSLAPRDRRGSSYPSAAHLWPEHCCSGGCHDRTQLGTATRIRAPLEPRRSGHRCFLGRTVVLTIGRLVASNPSFASVRAPAIATQQTGSKMHARFHCP